jgi:uncharacterized membrane protein YeaQ/YmgE (transglycosylase-associated protein family)
VQLIWAIIAGLIIGSLAKLFVSGRQDIPIWLTIVLGIIGGIAGNYLATVLGVRHTGGIDWIRHALQIAVAAVLISLIAPAYAYRSRRYVRY